MLELVDILGNTSTDREGSVKMGENEHVQGEVNDILKKANMKGCRTQQAWSLNTIGTSTTQRFIVGAIEKGPLQDYISVTISVRYPTVTSKSTKIRINRRFCR